MRFLDHEIKAAIFDMDGTLVDSTGLWHEIDKAFFRKRGMEIPSDYAQKIVHLGLKQAAIFTKEDRCVVGSCPQHHAQPALWPQLRVLQRGSRGCW